MRRVRLEDIFAKVIFFKLDDYAPCNKLYIYAEQEVATWYSTDMVGPNQNLKELKMIYTTICIDDQNMMKYKSQLRSYTS